MNKKYNNQKGDTHPNKGNAKKQEDVKFWEAVRLVRKSGINPETLINQIQTNQNQSSNESEEIKRLKQDLQLYRSRYHESLDTIKTLENKNKESNPYKKATENVIRAVEDALKPLGTITWSDGSKLELSNK